MVLVPLAGAALVLALARTGSAMRTAASGTAAVTLLLGLLLALRPASAALPAWGPRLAPALAATGVSRVMVALVPLIALPVIHYAAATTRDSPARLLALLLAFTATMELLVLAADWLTLLVGWELVGACSWALIAHAWWDPDRPPAARTAFLTTRLGDLGLYFAAGAALAATGSFRFDALSGAAPAALVPVAAGALIAASAKSAQLPFSPWLFAAMRGPTPVSALLHSATMVAAGAYLLIKLHPFLAAVPWLGPTTAALGLATALAGGVVATVQPDLKKSLAASTSAQYGLMFLAVGAGIPAVAAAHLVAHATFKALLFLGAGIALEATGTIALDALARAGLARALPRVAIFFALGALSLAAVPPLGGAFTKGAIVAAALGASVWLAAGALIAGAFSALYAGRLQLLAYGPAPPRGNHREIERPPRGAVLAVGVLAALTLAMSVLWIPAVARGFGRVTGGPDLPAATFGELATALAILALAGAALWWLWRRGILFTLGAGAALRKPAADWLGIPTAVDRTVWRPLHSLAGALAALDARVIDAGVRATGAVATGAARLLGWWGERGFEGIVAGVVRLTTTGATGSRLTDDNAFDAAVERTASGTGALGRASRTLQSGLSHQYYVILAAGTTAVIVIAAAAAWLGR